MPDDVISVSGQCVQMETRVCAGGCGMKFRVMCASKQKLARNDCDFICRHLVPSYSEMCQKMKEEAKEQRRLEAKLRAKAESEYRCAVLECYDLLNDEGRELRPKVVEVALKVCYQRSDGQDKKSFLKGMSTSNFSKSLGLEPRVFRGWLRAHVDIVRPLNLDVEFITRLEFDACVRLAQRLKGKTMPYDELFHEFVRVKEKIQKCHQ